MEVRSTYKDDLEQHFLVDLHELLVPLLDVRRLLTVVGVVVLSGGGVLLVVVAPLKNLAKNGLADLESVNVSDV